MSLKLAELETAIVSNGGAELSQCSVARDEKLFAKEFDILIFIEHHMSLLIRSSV